MNTRGITKRSTLYLLVMILVVGMIFTSCGSQETLEEYVASNSDIAQSIESASTDDMKVSISGNTITYSYTMPQQYEGDSLTYMAQYFESYMDGVESTFQNVVKTVQNETGISGITVKVEYLNNDGTEIYSSEYTYSDGN